MDAFAYQFGFSTPVCGARRMLELLGQGLVARTSIIRLAVLRHTAARITYAPAPRSRSSASFRRSDELDDTRYSREHSKDEERAEGVDGIESAADVLALKRGSPDDFALLFLALARAAGFQAGAVAVVNRVRDFFQRLPRRRSVDDLMVFAAVDREERVFNPGGATWPMGRSIGSTHWPAGSAGGKGTPASRIRPAAATGHPRTACRGYHFAPTAPSPAAPPSSAPATRLYAGGKRLLKEARSP